MPFQNLKQCLSLCMRWFKLTFESLAEKSISECQNFSAVMAVIFFQLTFKSITPGKITLGIFPLLSFSSCDSKASMRHGGDCDHIWQFLPSPKAWTDRWVYMGPNGASTVRKSTSNKVSLLVTANSWRIDVGVSFPIYNPVHCTLVFESEGFFCP